MTAAAQRDRLAPGQPKLAALGIMNRKFALNAN